MTVIVGTSGWQYRSWAGHFYPQGLPQKRWLSFYSSNFDCVEVNNTFYHLPARHVFESWAQQARPGFHYALKFSRYLTHLKRLRDPAEPVQRFLERARALGPSLGPVLLQLPPRFPVDVRRLEESLACFPEGMRIAVEFRDRSWFTESVRSLLSARQVALCLADRCGRPQGPLWATADWGFIRLHEGTAAPRPCYGDRALDRWAERISDLWDAGRDVYVFFNNDGRSCAPRDATRFASFVASRGGLPTRVPDRRPLTDDGRGDDRPRPDPSRHPSPRRAPRQTS
ncbi:MAG: DUF72 domain-containing protein [Candidatus Dormibacteria bacterium]